MKDIRQLIQKGDPMIRANLPTITLRMLETLARKNKRKPQDQLIKSLVDTFNHEENYLEVFDGLLPDIKKTYRIQ